MRLEQLIYILETEKQRSFSKAAAKLYIAQSSLSSAIANLEKELDVKIFIRSHSNKEIVPTGVGLTVLDRAAEILQMVDDLTNIKNTESLVGHLEFSSMPMICSHFLYEGCTDFLDIYPNLELIVHEQQSGDIINEMFRSKVGIGLISTMPKQPYYGEIYNRIVESREFRFLPLFSSPVYAFVSQESSLANLELLQMPKIWRHKIATFQSYSYRKTTPNYLFTYLRHKEFVNPVYTFSSLAQVVHMLSLPETVVILPQCCQQEIEMLTTQKIAAIPIADFTDPLNMGFLYCSDYRCSSAEDRFMRHMQQLATQKIESATAGYYPSQDWHCQ